MEIQIKSVVVGGKAENKDDLQMRVTRSLLGVMERFEMF